MLRTLDTIGTRQLLEKCFLYFKNNGLAYAAWRMPEAQTTHLVASGSARKIGEINLEELTSGFLMAPFTPGEPSLFIPAEFHLTVKDDRIVHASGTMLDAILQSSEGEAKDATPPPLVATTDRTGGESYKQLVTSAIEEIHKGTFEKVVLSRVRQIEWPPSLTTYEMFLRLATTYPQAMVTLVSSESSGTWMGATPELLVRVEGGKKFFTAAVAGTQPYHEGMDPRKVTWTQKDIEEQALVERYVISCFKKIRLREYEEHGPRTIIAGNVLHLKTEFEVDMEATNFPQLGTVMLKLLHPTSAVCGMPLDAALQFIQKGEGHQRGFYTGFLGPVQIDDETSLFVNLRCMQLLPGHALLYAGAGIVNDSNPDQEWLETEVKMNTLLRVIRQ